MLANKYLRVFHFNKVHEITIKAPVARIWPLVRDLDFGSSWVIRLLFALRGLPPRPTNEAWLLRTRFVKLEQIEGEALLIGLIGKFWRPKGELVSFKPDEFFAFEHSGFAKAVWSFELLPMSNGDTRIITETRILCTDPSSRRKFSRYWFFVRPFSGIVRMEILKGLKKRAEAVK